MKPVVLLIPLAFVAMMINPALTRGSEDTAYDWTMRYYDPQQTGFTPAKISENLELKWFFETEAEVWTTPAIANGGVYVGAGGWGPGWFYCLSEENGELLWKFWAPMANSSPVLFDDKVYFGDGDNFYCLNAENGTIIWAYRGVDLSPTEEPYHVWEDFRSPTIVNNMIYVASSRWIHCLNVENGGLVWRRENLGNRASPAVAYDKVYIGGLIPFSALDAENGDNVWSYPIWTERSSAAVAYGKVYVGSLCYQVSKVPSVNRWENRLYCFDAENGEVLWFFETEGEVLSSPAVAYGKVYVGDAIGNLYCLNAENRELIWKYYTGSHTLTFSPIVADGKVFVGDHAGDPHSLQCLDAETGEFLWGDGGEIIQNGTRITYGPIEGLSISNGKLYAGTHGNLVLCFGPRSPEQQGVTPPGGDVGIWLGVGASIAILLAALYVLRTRFPR